LYELKFWFRSVQSLEWCWRRATVVTREVQREIYCHFCSKKCSRDCY